MKKTYDLNITAFGEFKKSKINKFSFENRNLKKKLEKTMFCKTTAARWKSYFHDHQILIPSQNETSIHEEYFACGRFSYQFGFVNEKYVQRRPRCKKSRCSWDGVYLWQRAVNRQPDSRSDNS